MIASSGLEKGVASVGNLDIAYEAAGSGEPPVLFIHGFFGDRSYYSALRDHCAKTRRVVALDLRAHGESGAPDRLAVDDFVTDVIAVADAAGLRGAVLCGHSMAGVVALKIAAQRPDLVAGIVMLDGTVLFPEPMRRSGLDSLVPALATSRWREAIEAFFSRALAPEPPEVKARVTADMGRMRPDLAAGFFSSIFVSDFSADLTAVQCPLLYVQATAPTDLARLSVLRPDAVVGRVVGSGHWMMLTVPDQVNAMLDRFFDLLPHGD